MTALAAPPAPAALPGLAAVVEVLRAPGTRTVVIAGSKDVNPKVTVLVLPAGHARPTLALKVATTEGAGDAVRREAALLRALHALALPAVTAAVPRCVDVVEHEGLPVLVATAMPGRPLVVDYHRWRHTSRPARVLADLARAGAWLEGLQARATGPGCQVGAGACDLAEAAARGAGPADSPDEDLLGVVVSLRERLAGAITPSTPVHGDYWCGNVLATGGHVSGVVDWECGALSGDPLRDQARFVLSHALYLDRHTSPGRRVRGHRGLRALRWGDGVRWALLGRGWYPDAVRGFLRDALDVRTGRPDLWFDLALAGLAEIYATSDHPGFAAGHRDLLVELADLRPGRAA